MEVFGTILLVLGVAGMVLFYFTYMGGREVSPKTHALSVISLIIGVCAFLIIYTHWPTEFIKWVMLWLALMVAIVPMIVGCIVDIKNAYPTVCKFNFWTHAAFILSAFIIVLGIYIQNIN